MFTSLAIDIESIKKDALSDFIFVDLRELAEILREPVSGMICEQLPLSQFSRRNFEFKKDRKYVLFCAKGARSLMLAEHLHGVGIKNVISLNGGVEVLNRYLKQ